MSDDEKRMRMKLKPGMVLVEVNRTDLRDPSTGILKYWNGKGLHVWNYDGSHRLGRLQDLRAPPGDAYSQLKHLLRVGTGEGGAKTPSSLSRPIRLGWSKANYLMCHDSCYEKRQHDAATAREPGKKKSNPRMVTQLSNPRSAVTAGTKKSGDNETYEWLALALVLVLLLLSLVSVTAAGFVAVAVMVGSGGVFTFRDDGERLKFGWCFGFLNDVVFPDLTPECLRSGGVLHHSAPAWAFLRAVLHPLVLCYAIVIGAVLYCVGVYPNSSWDSEFFLAWDIPALIFIAIGVLWLTDGDFCSEFDLISSSLGVIFLTVCTCIIIPYFQFCLWRHGWFGDYAVMQAGSVRPGLPYIGERWVRRYRDGRTFPHRGKITTTITVKTTAKENGEVVSVSVQVYQVTVDEGIATDVLPVGEATREAAYPQTTRASKGRRVREILAELVAEGMDYSEAVKSYSFLKAVHVAEGMDYSEAVHKARAELQAKPAAASPPSPPAPKQSLVENEAAAEKEAAKEETGWQTVQQLTHPHPPYIGERWVRRYHDGRTFPHRGKITTTITVKTTARKNGEVVSVSVQVYQVTVEEGIATDVLPVGEATREAAYPQTTRASKGRRVRKEAAKEETGWQTVRRR
jgi:multimeric flavodoxin WrbA